MPLVLNSSSITGLASSGGFSSRQTGEVLQVVYANTTTLVTCGNSTAVDTTLTATITPTSSTSKIAIFVSHNGFEKSGGNTNNGVNLYLLRNSTNLGQFTYALGYQGSTTTLITSASLNYLDSPATTSALTYKTQFANFYNGASIRAQSNSDISSIMLMEIAA
jgi:hypothetical protein